MSDQISAEIARKYSKLKKARAWCKKQKSEPTWSHWAEGYRAGITEAERYFEAAITEILKGRK